MSIAKCLVSLKEAEISTACLQDDNFESKKELDDDLLHISNEIRIAINYLESINNVEDITFKDHWDIAGQWLDEDRQDNPEKYK